MSKVWEEIDDCTKQYRCALTIYLTTVVLSSYGIIMNHEINEPVHGKNVDGGLNATDRVQPKMAPTISFSGMYPK